MLTESLAIRVKPLNHPFSSERHHRFILWLMDFRSIGWLFWFVFPSLKWLSEGKILQHPRKDALGSPFSTCSRARCHELMQCSMREPSYSWGVETVRVAEKWGPLNGEKSSCPWGGKAGRGLCCVGIEPRLSNMRSRLFQSWGCKRGKQT